MQLTERWYTVNNIRLNVTEAGDATGEAILFLHGFPEYSHGWHKQLEFFAEKGYRVLAPDQRGYNLSSKPDHVKDYTLQLLTTDIAELIQQLPDKKVYLVGHDWGGVVAWALAIHYPQLLHKLIILNMPHPAVMHHHLRTNPMQMLRSWYAGFFQLPWLPEKLSSAFDFKMLERTMLNTSPKGTFTPEGIAGYKAAWRQPKAIKTMINWYRAYKYNKLQTNLNLSIPTLLIWGRKDKFLGKEMAEPSINLCTNGKLVFLNNATHWLHHEEPEKVNSLILEFIQAEA